jgi:hypothetical protein
MVTLTREEIGLTLNLNPTYTRVELFDGNGNLVLSETGNGTLIKLLPAGNYRMVLSAEGWQTKERTLSLLERNNRFSFSLERKAEEKEKSEPSISDIEEGKGLLSISVVGLKSSDFPIRIGGLMIDGEVALDPFKDRSGSVWIRYPTDSTAAPLLTGEHRLDALAVAIGGKNYSTSKTRSFWIRSRSVTRLLISIDRRGRLVVEFSPE